MFGISSATKVFVACGATDMRKSYNGLYGLVGQKIRQDPLSGHVFVFCNRSRNRIKVFYWDGSGFWVCAKRLEKGRFSWPAEAEPEVRWDREMLTMVLGGMQMEPVERKPWYRR
jgi:transposase